MTESEVLPFLTSEWAETPAIALRVWEAEGRRCDFATCRGRTHHALTMLAKRGAVERLDSPGRGKPCMWRLPA